MDYENPFVMSTQSAIKAAILGIQETVDIAVIGLSGGADSTLCACLCVKALGAENVIGVSMPYGGTDAITFNARSTSLAEKLGIRHEEISIKDPMDALYDRMIQPVSNLSLKGLDSFVLGNTRSRMRMVYLYALAGSLSLAHPDKRVRVIGTGNLSEDYIGYDTKWGDGACDVFPIGDFFKKEVYMALDYFCDQGVIQEEHIDQTPSAGLWEGQTDEGELGFTYDEMAPAILFCKQILDNRSYTWLAVDHLLSQEPKRFKEVVEFVWNRHKANSHKVRPASIRTIER